MLASSSTNNRLATATEFEPLKVVLPPKLLSFYSEHGYHPTIAHENRHQVRMRVRTLGNIRFHAPPCGLAMLASMSQPECGSILIKDLSRSGLGILYHRQILPGEEFEVYCHNRVLSAVAVRCRRVDKLCYETGAKVILVNSFAEDSDAPATGAE